MSKVAIAVSCHPDDDEFMMAGTLMRLKEAGYEIHYLNVANGSLGTAEHTYEEIVRIRRAESIAAAKMAGEFIMKACATIWKFSTITKLSANWSKSSVKSIPTLFLLMVLMTIWKIMSIPVVWLFPQLSAAVCVTTNANRLSRRLSRKLPSIIQCRTA